jgi:hypothetical protein
LAIGAQADRIIPPPDSGLAISASRRSDRPHAGSAEGGLHIEANFVANDAGPRVIAARRCAGSLARSDWRTVHRDPASMEARQSRDTERATAGRPGLDR